MTSNWKKKPREIRSRTSKPGLGTRSQTDRQWVFGPHVGTLMQSPGWIWNRNLNPQIAIMNKGCKRHCGARVYQMCNRQEATTTLGDPANGVRVPKGPERWTESHTLRGSYGLEQISPFCFFSEKIRRDIFVPCMEDCQSRVTELVAMHGQSNWLEQ